MPYQPSFSTNEAAIAGTGYDNLSDADLQKLIQDSYRLKKGKELYIPPVRTIQPKKHVDLTNILGGL